MLESTSTSTSTLGLISNQQNVFTLGCDSTGQVNERVRPTANSSSQPPGGNKRSQPTANSPSWPLTGAGWDLSDWGDEKNWPKAKPPRQPKVNRKRITISNSFQVLAEDCDSELKGVPTPHGGDGGSTSVHGSPSAAEPSHFASAEWSEENFLVWESESFGTAGSGDPAPTMINTEVSSAMGTLKPSSTDEATSIMGTLQSSESDNLGAAGPGGPAHTMVNDSFERHGNLEATTMINDSFGRHGNLEGITKIKNGFERHGNLETSKMVKDNFGRHGNLEALTMINTSSFERHVNLETRNGDSSDRQAGLDSSSKLSPDTAHRVVDPTLSRSSPVASGYTPSQGSGGVLGARGGLVLVRDMWTTLDSLD